MGPRVNISKLLMLTVGDRVYISELLMLTVGARVYISELLMLNGGGSSLQYQVVNVHNKVCTVHCEHINV